ncbi:kinase-like domain-containing protein [Mycena filopes]|nr:kinase-like domain-containing protein [Mycena filopes]
MWQIAADLEVLDHPRLQAELEKDQVAITTTLLHVLYSPSHEEVVLSLQEEAAQSFLDLLQHSKFASRDATRRVQRLMAKLAEKCSMFPKSLEISVTDRDEHISIPGGYANVVRASYQGKLVAVKCMRMFQDTDQRDIRRRFCREALTWQRLRNVYIVPLIGIDIESFPPFLCLVSPWMKNGTVNAYLSNFGEPDRKRTINRLIREIAQGLAFLHDERVVHGDLRGANILVDDGGHACLTDFGLTIVSDASTAQTKTSGGCVRWMAPEALVPEAFGLQNRPRTPASDIYSFGAVCLEVCFPKHASRRFSNNTPHSCSRAAHRFTMRTFANRR